MARVDLVVLLSIEEEGFPPFRAELNQAPDMAPDLTPRARALLLRLTEEILAHCTRQIPTVEELLAQGDGD
jgi:hypothetical protein